MSAIRMDSGLIPEGDPMTTYEYPPRIRRRMAQISAHAEFTAQRAAEGRPLAPPTTAKGRHRVKRLTQLSERDRAIVAEIDRKNARSATLAEAARRHVYVIGSAGPPIKIGIASDVRRRLGELQTSYPYTLRVYYAAAAFGALARNVERECHRRLAEYRLNGEWFDYDPYDAADLVGAIIAELSA